MRRPSSRLRTLRRNLLDKREEEDDDDGNGEEEEEEEEGEYCLAGEQVTKRTG